MSDRHVVIVWLPPDGRFEETIRVIGPFETKQQAEAHATRLRLRNGGTVTVESLAPPPL